MLHPNTFINVKPKDSFVYLALQKLHFKQQQKTKAKD
jgi:uncharacterized protein YpmS